jgi:hypothetical protein
MGSMVSAHVAGGHFPKRLPSSPLLGNIGRFDLGDEGSPLKADTRQQLEYAFHCRQIAVGEFTAAAKDNPSQLAGDATAIMKE